MEERFFLFDVDYRVDGDDVITRLYGKTKDGKKVVVHDRKTRPYFYVLPKGAVGPLVKELEKLEVDGKGFLRVETTERNYKGRKRKMAKVFLRNPREVPRFREHVSPLPGVEHTLEKDIVFTRRYMMDKRLATFGEVVVLGKDVDGVIEADEIKLGKGEMAEPKLMAIDIEVFNPKGEPRPEKDPIIAVSIAAEGLRKVLTWKGKDCQDFVEVLGSEKEVLERLVEIIVKQDPEVITGYYCDKFDFPYILKRARKLKVKLKIGPTGEELRISKRGRDLAPLAFGRLFLDVFFHISNVVSRGMSANTLTLNDVASELLGEGKEKLDYEGILASWRNEDIKTLASYSMKDADLTYSLGKKLLPNVYELGKLLKIPLYDVLHMTSGQVVEWFLISSAYHANITVPNRPKYDEISARRRTTYTGGFVKEPARGIWSNIAVCDFRSLYPSIIVSHNVDPFTLNVKECKKFFKAPTGQKFCRDSKGFVPQVIEKLLKLRFALKDKLKKLKKGTPEYSTIYARQNGLKLIANSTYGYMGYSGARWYSIDCAEAITSWARMYIKRTMEEAEKEGFKVIYGDSVTPDRFVTILNPAGIVEIKNVEELFEENAKNAFRAGGKEVVPLRGYRALTADPATRKPCWKPIREVIRHKTGKQIVRVNQKHGETCVTKDHSIIVEGKKGYECARPLDVRGRHIARVTSIPPVKPVGSIDIYQLLKSYSHKSVYKGREKHAAINADKDSVWFGWMNRKEGVCLRRKLAVSSKEFDSLLRLLALYIGEGSSSTPETTSSRWGASIACSDKVVLRQLRKDYLLLFGNARACIIPSMPGMRTLKYDGKTIVYKDKTHKLQMMNQLAAVMFKQLAGQKSTGKKIPGFVFHIPPKKQKLFLEWLLKGDGSKAFDSRYTQSYKKKNFSYTTKSLQLAGGFTFLLRQLGINFSINYRPSKKTYTIKTSDKPNARLETKVTRKKHSGYVYDLSVAGTHMFVDSCGQILLHNTDSEFISGPEEGFKEKVRGFVSKINKDLPDTMELELQGIYARGIFITKKRYAMISEDGSMVVKGLERVRRDWSPIAKNTQEKVLRAILEKNDPQLAKQIVEKAVADLRAKKVAKEDVVVLTQLTKDPDDYKLLSPHVAAAKRKKGAYRAGMTVAFIIVPGGGKTISSKARLAEEVGETGYDPEYYISNQLLPAVRRILEALGMEAFDGGKPQTKLTKFW